MRGMKDTVYNISGNVPSDISFLFISSIERGKYIAWTFTPFLYIAENE